jgi:hypothetical protein
MEQIEIKKLQVLHDRAGRILATVNDGPVTPGMPTVGIAPKRGQTLIAFDVPVSHQHLSMGQLFSRLKVRAGHVIVSDHPAGRGSSRAAKSRDKSKSRGRKK